MHAAIGILVIVMAGYVQANISYLEVLEAEFEMFKVEHGKSYQDTFEEQLRKQIFKDNKMLIDKHNERYAAGEETYEMGVNQFTDLLSEEFQSLMLTNFNVSQMNSNADLMYVRTDPNLPESIDWHAKGAVTKVKNQRNCQSCWAFAAAGALESHHFIKTKQLIPLSEQNLVDCSSKYKNNGCHGGWPASALHYIKDNGGIDTDASYPYEARDGKCRFKRNTIGAKVQSVVNVKGNEQALATAVANKGPIAVAVDATHFQHYHGGIFNTNNCKEPVNHGVIVVGYGPNYWLIKNSWGLWGEKGYMRLARNHNNMCHVASYGVYPEVL